MSTTAKFTGWVHGRAHDNTPVEITGYPLQHSVLTNVRVTVYLPALTPHEIAFHFDELPKGDFIIGSAVELIISPAPEPMTAEVPASVVEQPTTPVVTTAAMGPALVAESDTNGVEVVHE